MPLSKMALAEHIRPWSDLPTELTILILRRLPAHSDRVRFGAVCRHWSFSSKQHHLPTPLPWFALPDGTFFSLPHNESFRFPDSIGFDSSCGDWLFFSRDGTCFLKNPFSKITLTLPNLSCFCPIEEPVEIINVHDNLEEGMSEELLNMDTEMSICKVIVCSTFLVSAIVEIGPLCTVALCRPGDDSWLVSGLCSKLVLMQMMLYEGKLYIIDEFKDLLAIDIAKDNHSGKLSISRIERLICSFPFPITLIPKGYTYLDYFLVEFHGAILLVRRTLFGKESSSNRGCTSIVPVGIEIKVFKADFQLLKWVRVTSLGDDQALFISKSYSQSICVSAYKLKGNCIFILDDGTYDWFWKDVASSYIVYDMSDGTTNLSMPLGSFKGEKVKGEKAPATWLFRQ